MVNTQALSSGFVQSIPRMCSMRNHFLNIWTNFFAVNLFTQNDRTEHGLRQPAKVLQLPSRNSKQCQCAWYQTEPMAFELHTPFCFSKNLSSKRMAVLPLALGHSRCDTGEQSSRSVQYDRKENPEESYISEEYLHCS